MTPYEYIECYENVELKLATPLSNKFLGREGELEQGLKKLSENNILVISGISGVGKSRYALEICNKFTNIDTSYKFLCISNKGVSIYEDIHTMLPDTQNYLFLVDDANRITNHLELLLNLIKEKRKNKIKIVITVRDYAISEISDLLIEYKSGDILLESLKEEVIIDIIKSFGVNNPLYIEKIIDITGGNARIAVMCTTIALQEQKIDSLYNISQLYEIYFKNAYNQIKEIDPENALKVLGIISFFRTISKDNADTNIRIFSVFKIEEDIFWETCYRLNEKEFVDLFDNQVVKMPDQVLSTYLFYKVFFDTKTLDLGDLIKNFIDFEYNFYDTIYPLMNAFDYKNIKSELKDVLLDYWPKLRQEANHETLIKVISIFGFCIEVQSLNYLKRYIEDLPLLKKVEYVFDYDQNQMSTRSHGKNPLGILCKFRESSKVLHLSSLELMFAYIKKKPHEAGYLVYLLKESHNFEKENYIYGDSIQHSLFDFLIEHIENERYISIFSEVLFLIAPTFLKTHIYSSETRGNCYYTYNFCLRPSDSIKYLRSKIWDTIFKLFPYYKDQIYNILITLEFPREDDAKKIWEIDSAAVLHKLIANFDFDEFKACEATDHFLNLLDYSKIKYEKQLRQKATNRHYELSKLFTREYHKKDWRQDESTRKQMIYDYCKDFDFYEYVNLFNDVALINSQRYWKHDYSGYLSSIIADMASKDLDLYLRFLKYAIDNYDFNYYAVVIINAYFEQNPKDYRPILRCLEGLSHTNNRNWLTNFHILLPEHYIQKDYKLLMTHFFNEILRCEKSIWGIEYIFTKYSEFIHINELYINAINLLYKRITIDKEKIEINIDFFKHAFEYILNVFDEYCQLYYHCKLHSHYYDDNNDILKKILEYKIEEITGYIRAVYYDTQSVCILDEENFEFIWDLEKYEDILNLSIDYILSNDHWTNYDLINVFFTNLGENEEKAYQFIKKQIDIHYNDRAYMYMVFTVVASCLGKYKYEYIKQYLLLNPDIESFKSFDLFPNSYSAVGSFIPLYQQRIDEWEEILNTVKSLGPAINYLDHIEYLELQLKYIQRDLDREAKREFQERYIS